MVLLGKCIFLYRDVLDVLPLFNKSDLIKKQLDHIVYAVADLDVAMSSFESLLGVRPIFGGYHQNFGTKNALIKLDKGRYLELLAVDENNSSVPKPRWMGIDNLRHEGVTRWALRSDTLSKDCNTLKTYDVQMGRLIKGARKTKSGTVLNWELSMPLSQPEVELVPFLIDWSKSTDHPCQLLPEMNCSLVSFQGTHPRPEKFIQVFEKLGFELLIDKGNDIRLELQLQSPNGLVTL